MPRKETQIQWGNPEELLQWYIIRYDEDLYPGIILAIDKTHIPVKCMHRVGPNSFFCPACEDVLLYFLMMCLSWCHPQSLWYCYIPWNTKRSVGQDLWMNKWWSTSTVQCSAIVWMNLNEIQKASSTVNNIIWIIHIYNVFHIKKIQFIVLDGICSFDHICSHVIIFLLLKNISLFFKINA